jgi:RNA polymerase sigma-70 factor (ECF subfamily)
MGSCPPDPTPEIAEMQDAEIADRIRGGEIQLFEILMRRHNQRLYRIVRAVLPDEADVEDAMQQAYLQAFSRLSQFQQRSQFSTWLIRIALHEAFARRRKAAAVTATAWPSGVDGEETAMEKVTSTQPDPERQAYAEELRRLLESAVDSLPESYRTVFMMRDVEGLSTGETGEGLGLGEEAVKTRLHRARSMIRRRVAAQSAPSPLGHFSSTRRGAIASSAES